MEIFKNPLAVAFGGVLKNLRNNEKTLTPNDVADLLEYTSSSVYRMIEAGSTILNNNKVIELIRIPCFQEIRYDKLCRLLTATQIIERFQKEGMQRVVEVEPYLDKILGKFLKNEGVEITSQDFKECHIFLTKSDEALSFDDKIDKILGELPCVLNQIVEGDISRLRKEVSKEKKLEEFEKQTNLYKSIEVNILNNTAYEWKKQLTCSGIKGIMQDFQNISNKELVEKHPDNFESLWSDKDFSLSYLIYADKSKLKDIIENTTKFFMILYNMYENTRKSSKSEPKIKFLDSLKRINFRLISEESGILSSLQLDTVQRREIWFYVEREKAPYHIFALVGQQLSSNLYSYVGLTNRDSLEKSLIFDDFWKKAITIEINTSKLSNNFQTI